MDMETDTQNTFSNKEAVSEISKLLTQNDEGVEKHLDTKKIEQPDESQETKPDLTAVEGSDDNDESAASAESDETQSQEQKYTLKDLAKTLNVDVKELYDIELPIGDNQEPLTIGQFKDMHMKYNKVMGERDEYEQNKTRSDNEMMVARRQVEQLISLGQQSGQLTPDLITRIDEIHAENIDRERKSLLNVIPEWKDNTIRHADYESIINYAASYGFSRTEVEGVADHRLIKMMQDHTKRNSLIEQAKTDSKKSAPKNTGKSGKNKSIKSKKSALTDIMKRAEKGTRDQKVEAISALIT